MNFIHHPLSRRARWLLAAASTLPLVQGAVVTFSEATDPAGIFSSSTNPTTGTQVTTRSASVTSGSNNFTHWTLNGVRQSDPSGRSLNPVQFTIFEPTAAVAHYLPTTQDSDGDGVPDYFEIEFFNSLDPSASNDSDGDGIALAAERVRGTSPRVYNQMTEGGVSRRRGFSVTIVAPNQVQLTESSEPLGIVSSVRAVDAGAAQTLTVAPDPNPGGDLRFTGWYVGSTRVDSPLAPQPASLVLNGNTAVVARYLSPSVDADDDSIPDWYEQFQFSSLARGAQDDADADGIPLAAELVRAQSPSLKNQISEGGLSRRRSATLSVAPVTFVNCTLTSHPVGLIDEVIQATDGSEVVTDNLWGDEVAGLRFVGWEVAGVRQADPAGVSLGSARFIATEGIVATARFVSPTQDADNDGVADWYELTYLGTTSLSGDADPDGDGQPLVREAVGNFSTAHTDFVAEGGLSRRRTGELTAINLQPFERLEFMLVEGTLTPWFTTDPSQSPPTGRDFGSHVSPSPCDWDGDGDLDLFLAFEGGVRVFENTGSRHRMDLTERSARFGKLAALCSGMARPKLTAGDWNLDGRSDLVLADGSGLFHLIPSSSGFTGSNLGGASGTFSPANATSIPALGDLNGDGRPDLLVASAEGSIECYLHSGNPAVPFTSASSGGMSGKVVDGITSLAIADFTLDGINDVLAADFAGRIWEFHAVAGGNFALSSKVWGGSGAGFANAPVIAAADLDGDGDTDLLGGCPDGALFALRDPKVGRPTGLTASPGADSVLLEWDPDWQSRIKGYHVYRSMDAAAVKTRINPNIVGMPRYLDEDLQSQPNHYYHVTALTQAIFAGNSAPTLLESPPSATATVNVRRVTLDLQDSADFPASLVSIDLTIGNSVGIAGQGLDLRIAYPASLIPASQVFSARRTVIPSGLAEDLNYTTNAFTANGELRIQGTGGSLSPGQGKLFTLVFWIKPGTDIGSALPLTISSATVKGTDGATLPVTLGSGIVTVIARGNASPPEDGGVEVGIYGKGDLDGDGWATRDDYDLLKDFLHPFSPTQPTPQQLTAGDINGNGKLDHPDLVGILRIIQELDS